ncbi:MAG: hypothetical protein ABSA01_15060, partial [Anaerolineales bacterium]
GHLVHYVRLEDGGSRFSFHTPIESRFLKKEKAARDFSDSLKAVTCCGAGYFHSPKVSDF